MPLMSSEGGTVVSVCVANPQDPQFRERGCRVCVWDSGQRGEQGWMKKILIGREER